MKEYLALYKSIHYNQRTRYCAHCEIKKSPDSRSAEG